MTVTILIVEDDAAFAYAAWRHLEANGYRVVTVNSSMAALKKLDTESVDIVVTDIRLGKGEPHGLALARMIKNKSPNLPVILVTAYPDLVKTESDLPGQIFFKPVELSTLRNAVESALQK